MPKRLPPVSEQALRERIAHHLRVHREHKEWTQSSLAERVGIAPEYLRALEGARRSPSLRLLCELATAFGVDPARLVAPAPAKRIRRNPGRPRKRTRKNLR